MDDDLRIYPLEQLRPELCSYDCGSMNWLHNAIFENHPRFLERLGLACQELGIKPEIEIFDTGMLYSALYYIKKGVLKAPCHFQIVLGAPGGMTVDLDHLLSPPAAGGLHLERLRHRQGPHARHADHYRPGRPSPGGNGGQCDVPQGDTSQV